MKYDNVTKYSILTKFIGKTHRSLRANLGPEFYSKIILKFHGLLSKFPKQIEPFTIRPLVKNDRPQWEGMYVDYFVVGGKLILDEIRSEKIDAKWRRAVMEVSGVRGFVAETTAGELAGFVHGEMKKSSNSCYMADLYVVPPTRGTFVAASLMETLRLEALREGCSGLYWKCNNHTNQRGIHFYSNLEGVTLVGKDELPSGWWYYEMDINKPVRRKPREIKPQDLPRDAAAPRF